MNTLAKHIGTIASLNPSGVFNLGSRNGLSKADFAIMFAEELCLPTANIKIVKLDEVNFIKTPRPKDMRMSNAKFTKEFNFKFKSVKSEIQKVVKKYEI